MIMAVKEIVAFPVRGMYFNLEIDRLASLRMETATHFRP
jgi:hypothetical protein